MSEEFGAAAMRLYGAAVVLLGWRPSDFWNATPAELATALAPTGCVDLPDKETIDALMRRFPDR